MTKPENSSSVAAKSEPPSSQIHEDNIELSVYSCWTGKLLLKAKVASAKIDEHGKFITIDIDDDESAKPIFNIAALESSTQTGGLDGIANKLADFLERLKNGDENLADVVDDLTEYILKLREASTQTAGKAGDGEDSGAKHSARTPKNLTERNTVHAVHEPRAEVSASSPSPRPEPTQTQEGVRREIEAIKSKVENLTIVGDLNGAFALQEAVLRILEHRLALLNKKATERSKV